MATNRHLIILNSTSKSSAEFDVSTILNEWGTENNWFSIMDTIEITEHMPEGDKIRANKLLEPFTAEVTKEHVETKAEDLQNQIFKLDQTKPYTYKLLAEACEYMYELLNAQGKVFAVDEILKEEVNMGYQEYLYSEYGVTDLRTDREEHEQAYLVEVHMHD